MDSTLRILSQINQHVGHVTLTQLAKELNVDKQFLYARLKRMEADVMVFHGTEPVIKLTPSGRYYVNVNQEEEAGN